MRLREKSTLKVQQSTQCKTCRLLFPTGDYFLTPIGFLSLKTVAKPNQHLTRQ